MAFLLTFRPLIVFQCEPIAGLGFRRGSYKCVCKIGYYYPNTTAENRFFNGTDLEEEYSKILEVCKNLGSSIWARISEYLGIWHSLRSGNIVRYADICVFIYSTYLYLVWILSCNTKSSVNTVRKNA